jgi:hypothetical protein
MGIYEDVEDLKVQIKRGIASNNKDEIAELLKQAFSLCEKIKDLLKTADQEQKQSLNKMMQDLKAFLAREVSSLSKKMGLSEDELARYNENPENFTKEQWMVMQAIKKKFSSQTKEIRKIARGHEPIGLEKIPANWKELILSNPNITKMTLPSGETVHTPFVSPTSAPKKKKKASKRTKRSKWMKT